MNRVRAWLLAGVVGVVVGGGTFAWLVGDPSLALALVVVYAVGTRLAIEYAATLPGGAGRLDWQRTRWNAAFVTFVVFSASFAASAAIFDSFGPRVALQLLVFGVGWTGLFFGIAMTREQAAADESFDESGSTNGTAHRDHVGPENL